jgi:small subunit ribosomal protein S7
MSRRRKAKRRIIPADPRYNSLLVSSLINSIMQRGKKSLAARIVYGAFEKMSETLGKGDPMDILLKALENSRPKVEVKSRRVGGATYQVPIEISFERQQSLALRWIVELAEARKGVSMLEALSTILLDAYHNTGDAVKRKDEMHRMALANKAFAHLRW